MLLMIITRDRDEQKGFIQERQLYESCCHIKPRLDAQKATNIDAFVIFDILCITFSAKMYLFVQANSESTLQI